MKKNFITVTPDSGTSGSSNTISVAADVVCWAGVSAV